MACEGAILDPIDVRPFCPGPIYWFRTSPPWISELDYLQKEMRPIAALCTADQSRLFVRGLTVAQCDAVLKHDDEANRFVAGNIQAELASLDVEGFVRAA
jgi:hypothetical protein